ncbi:MAG: PGF-CTERM sorting domain-containing protein, partial [Salinigranum sp.]
MNRERLLAAAAGVVAVALLVVAAVPGVLADPTDRGAIRPGPVRIADVGIEPGRVSGGTAVLSVETRLSHRGDPTRNVTLDVRAVDAESGLIETTRSVRVGNLTGDREVPVRTNLTVPREGGYRIETVVYRDGERVETGTTTVQGLDALTPEAARSSVGFAETDALPPLSFSVARADAGDNRTTLAVDAALTNGGDAPAGNLRVTLVLRQADSNIVAARESAPVDSIGPLETRTVGANVTVPTGYNYYIDAILWRGNVVIDTARTAANLDPKRPISVDQTETDVQLRVGDFERSGGSGAKPTASTPQTASNAPGFGVGVATVALLAGALVIR